MPHITVAASTKTVTGQCGQILHGNALYALYCPFECFLASSELIKIHSHTHIYTNITPSPSSSFQKVKVSFSMGMDEWIKLSNGNVQCGKIGGDHIDCPVHALNVPDLIGHRMRYEAIDLCVCVCVCLPSFFYIIKSIDQFDWSFIDQFNFLYIYTYVCIYI